MAGNNTSDDGKGGLDFNPVLEALGAAGETKPIVISGYAAKAPDSGNEAVPGADPPAQRPISIRIYSSLQDLTAWHEVTSASIIYRVTPVNPLRPATFFIKSDAAVKHAHPAQASQQAKFISGSLMAKHFGALQPRGAAQPWTLMCHPGLPPLVTGICHPIAKPAMPQASFLGTSVTDEECPVGMVTGICHP